ncbi:MAG: DNA-binding transcriptional LysR family regulator [Hyphomicrobiaceae bacterium]|jgi:DNA-binding transcriptional LysR family regulator
MELRSLMTFTAVAETGSFTRAGKKLEISQSAVSQQIRSLEESLGSALFARQARQVTLTQAGNVLLPYARQILRKVEEARAVVSDFEGPGRGRVSIGAGGAICHHVLPSVLSEFSERFGRIEVQVASGFSAETLKHTIDGTIDLGILLLPVASSGVVATELGRDELVAIAPPGHPWESLERVRPKDFIDQTLVTYARTTETFRILERFLLEQGVFPMVGMEISDLEAVKKMVSVGLGVSIVAGWAVRHEAELESLVVRPLGNSGLYRTWGLVRRSNEALTASQRGFINICTNMFPALLR